MRFGILTFPNSIVILLISACAFAQADDVFELPAAAQQMIKQHCLDCHSGDSPEGGVNFETLSDLGQEEQLELLNTAQEQLHFKLMPPEDAEQPTEEDRALFVSLINQELKKFGASKLEEKLRMPEFGNYVEHERLFSSKYYDLAPFTYDRRWLISEFIFEDKFNRILNHRPTRNIDGVRQNVIGDNKRRVNLTNPFFLSTNTGVRYYANETLNGGHLLTMMTNAKEAANYMIYLATRDARYVPAIHEVMGQAWNQKKILESREKFLNTHIERVLQDLYLAQHDKLLPKFERVEIKAVVSMDGEPTKKAPFHAANPGSQELELIFRSMQRNQKKGMSDEKLIELCERDWFNFGHNERQIQTRVTFLNNYMQEWRKQIDQHKYEQRYKPIEYRPLNDDEMKIISETIVQQRDSGDRFNFIIEKCLDTWREQFEIARLQSGPPATDVIKRLVEQLFVKILERQPSEKEFAEFVPLTESYIASMGNQPAIEKLIQTLFLRSDFVYRYEFGQGEADQYGRKMLSPRDASYALAYALTDSSPDEELVKAVEERRLNTREDYRREVERMLKRRDQWYIIDEGVERLQLTASFTNTPIRKLRFFREFFGYPNMLAIFKDNKRFGGNYDNSRGRLVGECDRLVDHILQKDQRVFETLLTTENFYVFHSGDNEAMTASSERIRRIYEYFKDKGWQEFEEKDLLDHADFLNEVKMRGVDVSKLSTSGRRNSIREFKTAMESFTLRFDKGQTAAAPYVSFPAHGPYNASTRTGMQLRSPEVAKFFNIKIDHWNYPAVQPAKVENRKGMLTHPAWLIAHAQNQETDPVKRGKWIREKLLAGTIPDVPVTVDAVIPQDHHKTLRQRLDDKTKQQYCWKCHKQMNPLGVAFEIFDDFGRYRKAESLEHPDNLIEKGPDKAAVHIDLRDTYKTLPINSQGYLAGTGDKKLDGEVEDALQLIDRLSQSPKVRQSIIRHAFRYFLGRNERLSDSKTLIDADKAYLESGGSFDAVIVSLLTSDSFIYRKELP